MGHPTEFSVFATRLREFIRVSGCRPELDPFPSSRIGLGELGFEELALALFRLQYNHNAPYRRFCEARKVRPEALEDCSRIPAIPTTAFKEFDLSCLRPDERTTVFHSSGTTAQRPSRHFHNGESLALYEASLLSWFGVQALACSSQRGGPSKERMVFLTPTSGLAPHSSLVHMFETVRREFGAHGSSFVGTVAADGAWTLDLEATRDALRKAVRDAQPVLLLGTAFSFVHLLDHLADQELSFELPPGSRAFETGGYKSRSRALPKAELHSLITHRLGIPSSHILCEYGMSELSSQAYDCTVRDGWRVTGDGATHHPSPVTRHLRFPPWCRVQIISPESGHEVAEGENGLIRLFDLANIYSVLAIQTEDLGIRRGDGFDLIGRAELAEPRGCSLMALEVVGH